MGFDLGDDATWDPSNRFININFSGRDFAYDAKHCERSPPSARGYDSHALAPSRGNVPQAPRSTPSRGEGESRHRAPLTSGMTN